MRDLSHRFLVLARRPFRESEDIVDGFTDHWGRVSAVVRKSRSLSGLLEPPVLLEVRLSSVHGLSSLTQPVLESSYGALRRDLKRLAVAGFLGRLFLASVPERTGEGDYFLLLESLFAALNLDVSPLSCGVWGQERLLGLLGVSPELEQCLSCGVPEVSGFSASDGGVLCRACYKGSGFALSDRALRACRTVRDSSLESLVLEPAMLSVVGRLYKEQFQAHLGVPGLIFKRVLPREVG